jgi:hypothetical protein
VWRALICLVNQMALVVVDIIYYWSQSKALCYDCKRWCSSNCVPSGTPANIYIAKHSNLLSDRVVMFVVILHICNRYIYYIGHHLVKPSVRQQVPALYTKTNFKIILFDVHLFSFDMLIFSLIHHFYQHIIAMCELEVYWATFRGPNGISQRIEMSGDLAQFCKIHVTLAVIF